MYATAVGDANKVYFLNKKLPCRALYHDFLVSSGSRICIPSFLSFLFSGMGRPKKVLWRIVDMVCCCLGSMLVYLLSKNFLPPGSGGFSCVLSGQGFYSIMISWPVGSGKGSRACLPTFFLFLLSKKIVPS